MSVRLSVAMCTYNGAKYLEEQLRSLEWQSRQPDEVIILDDRSADETPDIVAQFARRAPFKVQCEVNARNVGTTRNFEAAIRQCTGDIILLSDQDDVWLPQKLARIESEFLAQRDIGCVFTDAEVTDHRLEPLGYNLWKVIGLGRREYASVMNGDCLDVLLRRNVTTGATMAFRAGLREAILPIPESWIHDEWIAVIGAALSRITAIREGLIKYRQHGGNQIGAMKRTLAATIERSLASDLGAVVEKHRRLLERLETHGGSDANRKRVREKISHLEARMAVREGHAGLWKGARELVHGRYGKYSNGLRSFVSDVLA